MPVLEVSGCCRLCHPPEVTQSRRPQGSELSKKSCQVVDVASIKQLRYVRRCWSLWTSALCVLFHFLSCSQEITLFNRSVYENSSILTGSYNRYCCSCIKFIFEKKTNQQKYFCCETNMASFIIKMINWNMPWKFVLKVWIFNLFRKHFTHCIFVIRSWIQNNSLLSWTITFTTACVKHNCPHYCSVVIKQKRKSWFHAAVSWNG